MSLTTTGVTVKLRILIRTNSINVATIDKVHGHLSFRFNKSLDQTLTVQNLSLAKTICNSQKKSRLRYQITLC